MDTQRWVEAVEVDGRELGRRCRERPDATVRSCPDWRGADLIAHASGFCRTLGELFAGGRDAFGYGFMTPSDATMVLELTDLDETLRHDLPNPGAEIVVRGTASELNLALWHRRDPTAFHVAGDRAILETWPHI